MADGSIEGIAALTFLALGAYVWLRRRYLGQTDGRDNLPNTGSSPQPGEWAGFSGSGSSHVSGDSGDYCGGDGGGDC